MKKMLDEKELMNEMETYFDKVTPTQFQKDLERANCLNYVEEVNE
jgi:hypothetical protein